MNHDQKLDQLLKSQPLTPREDFAAATLARLRTTAKDEKVLAEHATGHVSILVRFAGPVFALGAAAVIALGFFLRPDREPGVESFSNPQPATMPSKPHREMAPASFHAADSSFRMEDEQDLLEVENSLKELEFLLNENNLEFLYLLSADLD